MDKSNHIAFIGIGVMGAAMVNNLIARKYTVSIFNRTIEKAKAIEGPGVSVARSPREAVQDTNVVLLCLTNSSAVEEVLFGKDGIAEVLKKGAIVIDLSTISPSQAMDVAKRLSTSGITYLDSPVSGGDVGARNGTLTIMVGGDRTAYKDSLPIFQSIGKKIEYMGPSGSGQKTKCVNQIAVAIGIASMTEAMVFAKRSGLNVEQVLDVIGSGAAGSWALQNYAPRVLKEDFAPGFHAVNMLKDLRFVQEECEKSSAQLEVTDLVTKQFETLIKDFGADFGNHALIKLYT